MSRCGTNLLERCLRHGRGYFSFKLGESRDAHPMKGDGLFQYVSTFRHRSVHVVCQTRDPDACWKSIEHAQELRPGFLSHFTDRARFDELLEQQHRNFDAFEERLSELGPMGVRATVQRIAYEDLGDPPRRAEVLQELAAGTGFPARNVKDWRAWLQEHWMKKPVTTGRLRSRLSGRTRRRRRR